MRFVKRGEVQKQEQYKKVTVTVTDSKSAITKMFKKGSYSPTKAA